MYTFTIIAEEVKKTRRALPFLKDMDEFEIKTEVRDFTDLKG